MEVSGAAPLIESSTSDLGTVVDQKQVADLPLSVNGNMRNPESFVFLAPGVTGDTANTEINGSQDRAKEVLVDGAQSTGPESGGTMFTYPPVEAIGEFKLEAANFSAEYGKTGGGFEIFTTKSGTNQFHGSVFEYLRNDKFDARGFISPITPVNRQNEFGAAIGGPVILPKYNGRNRTFFYFVYDGFRYRAGRHQPGAHAAECGAAQRRFFGPRPKAGVPLTIYDPYSHAFRRRGRLHARCVSRRGDSGRTASARSPRPCCSCCPRPTRTRRPAITLRWASQHLRPQRVHDQGRSRLLRPQPRQPVRSTSATRTASRRH